MKIDGVEIEKLASELAIGAITEQAIRAKFGPSILAAVLAIGAGAVAADVAGSVFKSARENSSVFKDVTDVGADVLGEVAGCAVSLIDDVFSLF